MGCESCGAWAETRMVGFYYNIGIIVMRFSGSKRGNLCKPCINSTFWKYTAINLCLGWWGIISFFFTIGYLIANVVQFAGCRGMSHGSRAHTDAQFELPEMLSASTTQTLLPWRQNIAARLSAGASAEEIAREFASVSHCSHEQVRLYVREMATANCPNVG